MSGEYNKMSSMSPGDRLTLREPGVLKAKPLDDPTTRQRLATLRHLLETSYGPRGRLHLVHNDSGGHVTATTSSCRLLQSLSVSDPILRLLTTAVQGHLRLYPDGGHLVSLLSLTLIENSLNLNIHRRLIAEINESLLESCLTYLQSDGCECRHEVTLARKENASTVVKSILTSKPGALLPGRDLDHVVQLNVAAFLETFPWTGDSAGELVRMVGVEGESVSESRLVRGVLFEAPQIPTYRKSPLKLPIRPSSVDSPDPHINVALVKISMAGDSQDFLDVNYETDALNAEAFQGEVVSEMTGFAERLVLQCHVGLLACQRVVHPRLKKFLRQRHVLVLDRLGANMFAALADMTGGVQIASYRDALSEDAMGCLRMPVHEVHHGKSHVLLRRAAGNQGVPVCTLLLYHRSEQALEELKEACRQAQRVLALCGRDPRVLSGGGCWLTCLSNHIHAQLPECAGSWSYQLGCKAHHVTRVAHNLCRSLEHVAVTLDRTECDHVTDSTNHHHFIIPHGSNNESDWLKCQCGAVTYRNANGMRYRYLGQSDFTPSVETSEDKDCFVEMSAVKTLDGFTPYVNALKTAINVANMVLGIQSCVTDTN